MKIRAILKNFGCVSPRSATFFTGVVALIACLGLAPSAAFADTIGGIDFAVLGLGSTSASNQSLLQVYQSGTVVTGNVGQGPFTGVSHGIDVSQITGSWFLDPINNCGGVPCNEKGVAQSVTPGVVNGGFVIQDMASIVDTARDQSQFWQQAVTMNPTMTIGNISGTTTIQLTPGLNRINVLGTLSINGGNLALNLNCPSGHCQAVFNFAATGTVKNEFTFAGGNTTVNFTGAGQMGAADVLWNFPGNAFSASDVAIQVTSSAIFKGTILAPNQGILIDNGTVNGEVVGGGNGALLSIHSSSKINLVASDILNPPAEVPEPSSLILLGTGLAGLVGATRRKMRLQTLRNAFALCRVGMG